MVKTSVGEKGGREGGEGGRDIHTPICLAAFVNSQVNTRRAKDAGERFTRKMRYFKLTQ